MMTIDELDAADAVLENTLDELAAQIYCHENRKPWSATTPSLTTWMETARQLADAYISVVQQRQELVRNFENDARTRTAHIFSDDS